MVAYSKPKGFLPMLFALIVFVQATVALHGAHHHNHVHRSPEALESHLEEMENLVGLDKRANNIAIRGARANNSPLSPRLEIRDLQRNADQWNLYLLGMERFMAKPQNDRESYYQIAGVHSTPYVSWNNFGNLVNTAGFCPHAQTLFGSWHRPYLAVFEQALYNNIQEVINQFPSGQQARWRTAARTLRMPYYDWARNPNGGAALPTSIRDQTVTVTKPSGRVTIPNPLYSYRWGNEISPEIQRFFPSGAPWNNFGTTLRRPVANPTRSNNNALETRFRTLRNNLASRVYGLFMSGASWGAISTTAIGVRTNQNGPNADSLEAIHDVVHGTVGGDSGGHMTYIEFSAFEPLFWLHHTNVDRLLAMYQVVSPNTYVANGVINHPMAQWNAGEPKNSYSPLKPFTKDTAGNYWTSQEVRDTSVFNYNYPETGRAATAASVRAAVNSLYGPSTTSRKRSAGEQYPGRPFREGDYHTVLSIMAQKYAIEGSYTVHCFLGKPDNSTSNSTVPYPTNSTAPYGNETDITEDPNYVGAYTVMGKYHNGGHANLTVMTEGCVPLTNALQGKEESGELKSLTPKDVEAYLEKNLHYKVIGPGDVELDADKVPGLHFYVKTAKVTPSSSPEELPSLGDYLKLPDVTKYLPAGKPFEYIASALDWVDEFPKDEEGYPTIPNIPYPSNIPWPSDIPSIPLPGKPQPSGTAPEVSYPTGVFEWPSPEAEAGYCITKQTIEYVDEKGNFLYADTY